MLAVAYPLVLLPVAFATDWTFGPILVGTGSFAIAIAAVWRRRTFGNGRPRPIDLVVGEVHALSFVAVTGLLWMLAYVTTYWPVRGISKLWGNGSQIHAPTVAQWVSLSFAILISFSLAAGIVAILWSELYPDDATTAAVYRQWGGAKRRVVLVSGAVSLSAWVVMLALIPARGWPDSLYAIPVYALLIPLAVVPRTGSLAETASSALDKVRSDVERLGYTVLVRPITDSPETAPLVDRLHLLAYRKDRGLAIQVKGTAGSRPTADWTAATDLVIATRALNQAPDDLPPGVAYVEPVLVLVEAKATEALDEFVRQEEIHLVRLSDEQADDGSAWSFADRDDEAIAAQTGSFMTGAAP
jgi:hypothetical protein